MKHRHMPDEAVIEKSYDWIVNYENAEHTPVYIYDGISRKERVIIVPISLFSVCRFIVTEI